MILVLYYQTLDSGSGNTEVLIILDSKLFSLTNCCAPQLNRFGDN